MDLDAMHLLLPITTFGSSAFAMPTKDSLKMAASTVNAKVAKFSTLAKLHVYLNDFNAKKEKF